MNIQFDTQHHFVPDLYVMAMNEVGITEVGSLRFPKWSPTTSLRMMDAVGIEKGVLSISTPGVDPAKEPVVLARRLNEFIAEQRSSHPERFGGFAAIPLCNPEAAAAEAVYALDTLGFEGVGLMSNSEGRYLGDPRFTPLFSEIDARDGIVFIHPNDPVEPFLEGLANVFYGWPVDTSRSVLSLERAGVFDQMPNITFLLGHGGGALPAIAEIVKRRPQLMADTAKVTDPLSIKMVMETFGRDRVTFGSDFPWGKKARFWKTQLEKEWRADEESLEAVFRNNARALFAPALEEVR